MEYSPNGVKVGGTSDTILILGVLGLAGFILWKTGIFGTVNSAAKVADTALAAVGTVVTDVADLPANIAAGTADAGILAQSGIAALTSSTTPVVEKIAVGLADIGSLGIGGGIVATYYSINHPVTTQSIFNDAIKYKGKAMDGLTAKTMTMIYSVYERYVGVTCANWSAMAVANGAKFSSTGTITGDNTLSLGESQINPVASD